MDFNKCIIVIILFLFTALIINTANASIIGTNNSDNTSTLAYNDSKEIIQSNTYNETQINRNISDNDKYSINNVSTNSVNSQVSTANNSLFLINYNGNTFSRNDIVSASSNLRKYIENMHKLPLNIKIAGVNVTMSQYLELAVSALLQINSGNNSLIPLKNFSAPTYPRDNIQAGNIPKSEYLHIASDVKNYMDSSGKTPDFAYNTSLGTYLGYQNLVYMYSMILDYYNSSGKMADWAGMRPWSIVSAPILGSFTNKQVINASKTIKAYVLINNKLPATVTINNISINMAQFLKISTTALLQISQGKNNLITLTSFSNPTSPKDNIRIGKIYKTEYLKIAGDVKNYMDTSGKTPDFAYNTSLGTFLGFENMVYMYSMILVKYNTSAMLPDYVDMKPWYVVSKSFQTDVIITGTGGYVTNNGVINNYIPKTTVTNKIIQAAVSGTPMFTFGNGKGPKVMIVAGVHGNELPAQIAAVKLANYLNGKSLNGTVYIIPFVIPSSTSINSRYWNGINLNREANVAGTPTNKIYNLAKRLSVNALGDFHSTMPGGDPGRDIAMCSLYPTTESYNIASYISRNVGCAFKCYNQAGVDYPGALEDVSNLGGIPSVTCEVLASHTTANIDNINTSFNQMMALLHYEKII